MLPETERPVVREDWGARTDDRVLGERDPIISNDAAIQQLADAKCTRLQRCNDLGPDGKYADMQACQTRQSEELRDELGRYECPNGINKTEFDECVEEIQNHDCNNPFDALGEVIACRESDMCNVQPGT